MFVRIYFVNNFGNKSSQWFVPYFLFIFRTVTINFPDSLISVILLQSLIIFREIHNQLDTLFTFLRTLILQKPLLNLPPLLISKPLTVLKLLIELDSNMHQSLNSLLGDPPALVPPSLHPLHLLEHVADLPAPELLGSRLLLLEFW